MRPVEEAWKAQRMANGGKTHSGRNIDDTGVELSKHQARAGAAVSFQFICVGPRGAESLGDRAVKGIYSLLNGSVALRLHHMSAPREYKPSSILT